MRVILFLLLSVGFLSNSYSQSIQKCGHSFVYNVVAAKYPAVLALPETVAMKTTQSDSVVTIPIVFHIVLTKLQLAQLGGETVIPDFINTQVTKITNDFMGQNADSTKIPPAFKEFYGKARMQFALAHTAPDGSATPGYEIKVTTKTGFNLQQNTYGSETAFSDAKYATSGGLDSWDPATYVNVWVLNVADNAQLLGLCIPPSFVSSHNFPSVETGVVLSYRNWRPSLNSFQARTLTHELGHFFELFHIWGDDEGKCPSTGGQDDGIEDTPPQAYENYGCPVFPKYDGCTRAGAGLMFMNFMDYTDDQCQQMFTHQQVAKMRAQIQPFGTSYALTQHPDVLKFPTETSSDNSYVIYPNPGDGRINIRFNRVSNNVKGIRIINMMGQTVASQIVSAQKGFYYFDLSGAGTGIYFAQIEFTDKTVVKKVLIR
ncbi:zinc-dependent metalloprotease [Polluticoccus soli]|uniref:zinc-dependent metalloprotease n=1 Tax=Polluticoccus soli TaxID=3034150 RepID=UPI0023E18DFD|nr:zinc-dependent metalloprotease [Flavipsychrobacter sp. JY13-12]